MFKQKNSDKIWLFASIPGATKADIFDQARIPLTFFLAALHTQRWLLLDVTIAASSITVIVTSCRRTRSIITLISCAQAGLFRGEQKGGA
ncbi:hypothetical protein DKX38_025329 [Salix brachista]|uniref:Uncharacterized protein n=1 Tax=Salix brachista TaxID=2182728 RepID=A0A5N5JU42_9ROSI|nr:hypothetical protein DKX38_025329 [Salix brachista]